MSMHTNIEWCDSAENPVMGCDGCPLFPSVSFVQSRVEGFLISHGVPPCHAKALIDRFTVDMSVTDMVQQRRALSARLCKHLSWPARLRNQLERLISAQVHCYAATLHLRRGRDRSQPHKKGHPGFAPYFEQVTLFPGRMARAAAWKPLQGLPRLEKPWLNGLPRLIFVSDMGDALSASIPFDYLLREIVDVVDSAEGRQHIWLWLTKRPARMAKFGRWLQRQGREWPRNLVAMTSVLNARMAKSAIKHLMQVPAAIRGLSVEPLLEPVSLDLARIDWVIVGGESGNYARPFHLEWARAIAKECRRQGVAFFMKQLGAQPFEGGSPLKLKDRHGGDWNEWPQDLRVREMPERFKSARRIPSSRSKGGPSRSD